jgi:hypothetical protein
MQRTCLQEAGFLFMNDKNFDFEIYFSELIQENELCSIYLDYQQNNR